MTPKQKCVSLETAKRLKAAGFPQETERSWRLQFDEEYQLGLPNSASTRDYAAPDAQELLARIHRPVRIELSVDCNIRVLIHESEGIPEGEWFESDGDENLVDVLSSAWLWLKEQKLL